MSIGFSSYLFLFPHILLGGVWGGDAGGGRRGEGGCCDEEVGIVAFVVKKILESLNTSNSILNNEKRFHMESSSGCGSL